MNIDRLLDTVIKQGASDLHLTCDRPPTLRLNGRLRSLKTKVLTPDDTVSLMKAIAPDRSQQELQEEGTCDFGFAYGEAARFRVSIFRQRGNIALCLRQIPNKLLTFEQIGLPRQVQDLLSRPRGLFLVTGPTGSGKTTTLATMIDYVNQNLDRHIITIEDPIEYYHTHKKSIINQREVGTDVTSFAEALRRALRQDPDVILVGEMRDLETIEAALRAAETGHLVFGTLHTNSAGSTINRVIDAFPVDQQNQIRIQLSAVLKAIISMRLLPRADGLGRVPAVEVLISTPYIRDCVETKEKTKLIRDAIAQGTSQYGMQTFDQSLYLLYKNGLITLEEAIRRSTNPDEFRLRYSVPGEQDVELVLPVEKSQLRKLTVDGSALPGLATTLHLKKPAATVVAALKQ